MLVKLIARTFLWLTATAALLFVPAGTLDWPAAWIMLGQLGLLALTIGLWLAHHDPGLLRERMSFVLQKQQQTWDRPLMGAIVLLWNAWYVVMGLDVAHNGLSQIATWLQALGALGVALCGLLAFLAFRENTYAAPVVKIQQERGQAAITTGPYRLVRHPMYAGAIPYFLGVPLLLGSPRGLALAPILIGLLALRAVMEERTLRVQLAGYADYAARVRYRLIPFVW
jgi:protein-S-isoprenylcysteine O-methyltransferase Ste14